MEPKPLCHALEDWTVKQHEGKNILFYKGRHYIPKDQELRREIVQRYHDHPTAGHPGEIATYKAINGSYWWPGMRVFVKNYVAGCAICQQYKINRHLMKMALAPIEGAKNT